MATVKEAKEHINHLKTDYDNVVKLQELFLGHNRSIDADEAHKLTETLECKANLNTTMRNLCSGLAKTLQNEIKRIETAIDKTTVNIDGLPK